MGSSVELGTPTPPSTHSSVAVPRQGQQPSAADPVIRRADNAIASQTWKHVAGPVVPQLSLPGSSAPSVRSGSPPQNAPPAATSMVPPLQLQPGSVQPIVGHRTSSSPIPERPGVARVPPPVMAFNGALVSPRPYAAQKPAVGPVVSRMHPAGTGAATATVRMG